MNASAVTINSQLRQQDSFSQTQDEYITILSTCNPEQKPRATCEAFIKMFRAYSRGGNVNGKPPTFFPEPHFFEIIVCS